MTDASGNDAIDRSPSPDRYGSPENHGGHHRPGEARGERPASSRYSGADGSADGDLVLAAAVASDVEVKWTLGTLRASSLRVQGVLAEATLDVQRLAALRLPVVAAGQVVAHRRGGRTGSRLGEGLQEDAADGTCRAQRAGYLCLTDGTLSVLGPVWVDAAGMQAYWLLLDGHAQPLTAEMIRQQLAEAGVVEGLRAEVIEELADRVRRGEFSRGAELVASGQRAKDGADGQVEILVDVCRLAGTERADGSIDFRQVNAIVSVEAGQLIARCIPPTPGVPGRDVRGEPLPAADGRERRLVPVENVERRLEGDVELFHATTNGVLRTDEERIAVIRLLHIADDVDFKTGNLDFDGEIHVQGTVIQGFSVKASGNVTVAGTVEPGARVTAGGDLVVGRGIVGRKTRAIAGGMVRAQFVQEATVTAGQDIVLGNYAHQARLRAGRRVRILHGQGSRGGSLIGGQAWARSAIQAHILGSRSYTPTALMAGVAPEHIHSLDRMKEGVDASYNQLRRLLTQFGLVRVDVGQIRNMIAAATGPRRKLLATRARKLGQVVQVYQKLLAARQKLEKEIGQEMEGAEIKAANKAYPGVEIRLGQYRRTLREEVACPRFHVREGRLFERDNV